MTRAPVAGLLALALLTRCAGAQVAVQSLGDDPLTVSRVGTAGAHISGGSGAVLKVRNSTVFVGGGDVTLGDAFADPSDPPPSAADFFGENGGNLAIRFTIPRPAGAAEPPRERVAEMQRLMRGLTQTAARQCELITAAFAQPCRPASLRFEQQLMGKREDRAHAALNFQLGAPAAR